MVVVVIIIVVDCCNFQSKEREGGETGSGVEMLSFRKRQIRERGYSKGTIVAEAATGSCSEGCGSS